MIEAGEGLTALLTGRTSPAEAIESGSIRVIGDPGLLTGFANTFKI